MKKIAGLVLCGTFYFNTVLTNSLYDHLFDVYATVTSSKSHIFEVFTAVKSEVVFLFVIHCTLGCHYELSVGNYSLCMEERVSI
jgi:hypothetical protein